jgi:membrane protease subunit (stomatin/prohibitin family)
MNEPEIEQLIGEVAQKHGLRLSRGDPVLVSVTLNEQILRHALGQLRESLEQANKEIGELSARQTEAAKTIAEQLITAAAGYIADEVRAAAADITANTDNLLTMESNREPVRTNHASWLAAGIAISAACVSGAFTIAGPVFLETKPALANCDISGR